MACRFRMSPSPHDQHRGLIYGLAAYGLWGLLPLYFWLVLGRSTPVEIVASRISWSFVFLCGVMTIVGGWGRVWIAVQQRSVLLALAASTLMIATNWTLYVYAIATNQMLQTSLGYFMAPLVNVGLGILLLGERLRSFQLVGILLAMGGVIVVVGAGGEVPTIAIAFAISFGLYGLLRKLAPVDGATCLLIETAIMGPPAILLLWYLRVQPSAQPLDRTTQLLLVLSGIVTAVPLLFFGAAAKRLPLTTLGILQYLEPSVQFLFAVLLFAEPLPPAKLFSFALIWTAAAIYTYGSLHHRRDAGESPAIEPVPVEVIETA